MDDPFMYLCNFQANNFGFGHPVAIVSFSVPNSDLAILEKTTIPCIKYDCNIATVIGRVHLGTSHNPLRVVPKLGVLNPVFMALE